MGAFKLHGSKVMGVKKLSKNLILSGKLKASFLERWEKG
jgi:hypothetical protein